MALPVGGVGVLLSCLRAESAIVTKTIKLAVASYQDRSNQPCISWTRQASGCEEREEVCV